MAVRRFWNSGVLNAAPAWMMSLVKPRCSSLMRNDGARAAEERAGNGAVAPTVMRREFDLRGAVVVGRAIMVVEEDVRSGAKIRVPGGL